MKNTITLDSTDIDKAILGFVDNAGFSTSNMTTTVKLIAGRAGNGNSAEVTLEPEVDQVDEVVVDTGTNKAAPAKKTRKTRSDKGTKVPAEEKVEPESEDQDEKGEDESPEESPVDPDDNTEDTADTDDVVSDADGDDESLFK